MKPAAPAGRAPNDLQLLLSGQRRLAIRIRGSYVYIMDAAGYKEDKDLLQRLTTDVLTAIQRNPLHPALANKCCAPLYFGHPAMPEYSPLQRPPHALKLQTALWGDQLLLWNPEGLFAKARCRCPECGAEATHDGWAPTARTMRREDGTLIWLLSKRYECKKGESLTSALRTSQRVPALG